MSLPKDRHTTRRLDPRSMRALAHPFRLTLLELVGQHGTLTATRAAELTGESSASCSFHLRQLAKYGFLEQAEGAGGRERPWRLTATSHEWTDEPEAADLLDGLLLARAGEQLSDWLTRRRQEPREWREAASGTFSLLYASPEELTELWHGLVALLQPFDERLADPGKRPEGARPVRFFASGFPLPDDRSQRDT